MQGLFVEYISLVLIIIALVMLANKLKLAYPIVLVVGGLAVSFANIFPHITIDPDLIFFIFLPPLLYEAAWQTTWKDFWKWRRVITSFAFPIVIITSCIVAFASYALIPGFTLGLGFLLGGIVSPPDAISATTIMRQVKAPKILVSIAEGESLLNDASSLIVFRFALAAIVTGQFQLSQAVSSFLIVVVMGTLIGVLVGFIFYAIYRWLPTTPAIEIILNLLAPYCMYYFAEQFHFSGVLAVVSGGLFLSNQRHKLLTYQGRVQGANVWSTLGFLLNGIVFMLIGLQLPYITSEVEEVSLGAAIWYGLAISLVLIVTRLCCTLGASIFTRFAARFITVADRNPGWRIPIVFGWSGMRGVVSLAAALSIPVVIQPGQPFPYRNLILIITFIVILVTLVFQGLTLPWLIKKMKIKDNDAVLQELEQELIIKKAMTERSIRFLEKEFSDDQESNQHVKNLTAKLRTDLNVFQQDVEVFNNTSRNFIERYQHIYLALLDQQRKALYELNREDGYDEELIRKYLSLLDLEETKLRELLRR
ncbi:Na+/H+ antiporter [Chryseosolibacter indicus]|uniref:Na+/H+ antiporter n=1 Tax=Chryseosolibacter indicus TaxID=2782351 RepID=A0ABS5VUX1_9BACT|nr:Na+/H+ antiporter [Chryseosolibacter indicus]MBT1704843.1 Na+/H+ antiporter [Chryseosolibacter indicus]